MTPPKSKTKSQVITNHDFNLIQGWISELAETNYVSSEYRGERNKMDRVLKKLQAMLPNKEPHVLPTKQK